MRMQLDRTWQRSELLDDFEFRAGFTTDKNAAVLFRAFGYMRSEWMSIGDVFTISGQHLCLQASSFPGQATIDFLLPAPEEHPLHQQFVAQQEWTTLLADQRAYIRCRHSNRLGSWLHSRLLENEQVIEREHWIYPGDAFRVGDAYLQLVDTAPTLVSLIDPYK